MDKQLTQIKELLPAILKTATLKTAYFLSGTHLDTKPPQPTMTQCQTSQIKTHP